MVIRQEENKEVETTEEKVLVQEVEITLSLLNTKLNYLINLLENSKKD